MSSSTAVAPTLGQDWKYPRTAKGFTGAEKSVSSTVLRCVTNTRIPCTAQEFASMGKTRFTLTVIGVGSIGWAYAPYKKPTGSKKVPKDPNAKPLFEVVRNAEHVVTGVRMFSFKKAKSNFDRDEIDANIKAEIHVGQVMTFFVQSFMFDSKKSDSGADQYIFPRDMQFIPEFTVVDMHIMTSNNDTEGGYGCKLKRIALHATTLYSYMGPESLRLLPDTFERATELALERAQENMFVHNQFEAKNVAFFRRVPDNSFISTVPVTEGYYRIVGPNGAELFPGVPCVDIAQEDLFRFANVVGEELQDKVFDAVTLLDFSSASSALWMYVVGAAAYRNSDPLLSEFRGVPLVDVDVFLKSVDFDMRSEAADAEVVVMEDRVVFPFKPEIVSLSARAVVSVFTKPVVNSGFAPPCLDFSLVSEASTVTKGYLVTIGTRAMPDMLRVVLNVNGCMTAMPGGSPVRMDYASVAMERMQKRRRLCGGGAGGGADAGMSTPNHGSNLSNHSHAGEEVEAESP